MGNGLLARGFMLVGSLSKRLRLRFLQTPVTKPRSRSAKRAEKMVVWCPNWPEPQVLADWGDQAHFCRRLLRGGAVDHRPRPHDRPGSGQGKVGTILCQDFWPGVP